MTGDGINICTITKMKRKRTSLEPPRKHITIKDLPLELIHKISKYGHGPFIPSKDIGPLAPSDIDVRVNISDTQHPAHGQITQSMLASNSVLRSSEQGPATQKQTSSEKFNLAAQKEKQLHRELNILKSIYGPNHPATINAYNRWDEAFDAMMRSNLW